MDGIKRQRSQRGHIWTKLEEIKLDHIRRGLNRGTKIHQSVLFLGPVRRSAANLDPHYLTTFYDTVL